LLPRLPFPTSPSEDDADPGDQAGVSARSARPAGEPHSPAPWTVSALAGRIKQSLRDGLAAKVRVVGEVSNLSRRTHWFFSLKDSEATLRCVCFASNARRIGFEVNDGMEVVATGRIDFYDQQGHVQLYVDKLEPVGLGELEQRFRRLCEALRREGYFAVERKRALPLVPRRVAVVSSRSGAAVQDVIHTARRRWPGCELRLLDVRVQGASAAPQIAEAIERLSEQHERLGVDVVLLTRGGGSLEDLWAFNERQVADAVHRCAVPVVAAIGHEVDTTVAELVADVRCATPTQAAMVIVPDRTKLHQQVDHLNDRLASTLRRRERESRRELDRLHETLRAAPPRRLARARERLASIEKHPVFKSPLQRSDQARRRLEPLARRLHAAFARRGDAERRRIDQLAARLVSAFPRRLEQDRRTLAQRQQRLLTAFPRRFEQVRDALEQRCRRLQAVGPQRVLDRGFSLTRDQSGRIVRRATDVAPGQSLWTRVAEGEIYSTVEPDGSASERKPTSQAPNARSASAAGSSDPSDPSAPTSAGGGEGECGQSDGRPRRRGRTRKKLRGEGEEPGLFDKT